MPIDRLFVEGRLDATILAALCRGMPTVERVGGKLVLVTRVTDALQLGQRAAYLRDRDFDFEPGGRSDEPVIDRATAQGAPLGWRWSRHSLECYLLEPSLVADAVLAVAGNYESALQAAAASIRWYQAARWAIGSSRQAMVRWYRLDTGVDSGKDFILPGRLDPVSVSGWMDAHVAEYRNAWNSELEPGLLRERFDGYARRFDDGLVHDSTRILRWFSGKDLMAALAGRLSSVGLQAPGEFRARIRDWVLHNPEQALALQPEWRILRDRLAASPGP